MSPDRDPSSPSNPDHEEKTSPDSPSPAADSNSSTETSGTETTPSASSPTVAPDGGDVVTDDDGVVIAPGTDEGTKGLKRQVIDALRTCYDPEIPVNIYDLGMIYRIDVNSENKVDFIMTLTSPACPVAGSLPPDAERKVAGVEGVAAAKHQLVWEPAWNPDLMHEAAKLELGFYDEE